MKTKVTPEQILDTCSNGVLATDTLGTITYVNQKATKILNFEDMKITGENISKFLPKVASLLLKCVETGKSRFIQFINENNAEIVIDIDAVKQEKEVVGAVCWLNLMDEFDVTVLNQHFYKKLNRQLKEIVDLSSDGIWVCDNEGKVITINKASEKLSDIKARDFVGKSMQDFIERGLFDKSATLEVLKTHQKVNLMSYVTKTRKNLLVTGTPIFDDEGNLSMVVVNERDMTELNNVQVELEQNQMVTEKLKDKLAELSMMQVKGQGIIAESKGMRQVLRIALKLAQMEVSDILLLGESGSGKGLISKFIHNNSKRNKKPFIQINCAALPETLLEAELFGYEKGAFTGAREHGKVGLFELAQGGSLFLDEIGDLPLTIQSKLLTYLDNHEIRRLGGTKSKAIDCTIITATNWDLEKLVKMKKFRQDLFYRLNIFTVNIPPLRKRTEDIFELSEFFLNKYNEAYGLKRQLSPRAMELLQGYSFPGNVRELKNIIKKAVVLSETDSLTEFIAKNVGGDAAKKLTEPGEQTGKSRSLNAELLAFEKMVLKNARLKCKTTREMAGYLQISQPTVVRKMKKHDL